MEARMMGRSDFAAKLGKPIADDLCLIDRREVSGNPYLKTGRPQVPTLDHKLPVFKLKSIAIDITKCQTFFTDSLLSCNTPCSLIA
jgi:hypothetical protein